MLLFHYDRTRGSTVPVTWLSDYPGYLHTDGYAGYGAINRDPKITGLGCWAHVQRKFIKAQQALPKGQTSPKLHEALGLIGKLYAVERQAKDLKKANRIDEYAYREYVFTELLKTGGDDDPDALLPWNVKP